MVRPVDPELMRRTKSGEVSAFEILVDRYKSLVFGVCHSILRCREDAEEAAQDTFLKLFRSRDLYDESRPLEPWLLRIAGNASRDLLRRRMSGNMTVVRDGEGDRLMRLIADPRSTQSQEQSLTRQAVRHAIDQMNERFRQPLVLRYLNGLNNRQIAESLGISISNLKVRLARAKDVLQSRLQEVRD
jgi:RNA polymerase sigma-70 factor (ECF subfamily)